MKRYSPSAELPIYKINTWYRDRLFETVAHMDDFDLAKYAFHWTVKKHPEYRVTLQQGARVIKDSGRNDVRDPHADT